MRLFKFVCVVLVIGILSGAAQAQVQAHVPDSVIPTCFVASEGIFRGSWVKHRIYRNEEVVYGANDLGTILRALENLRSEGLCR